MENSNRTNDNTNTDPNPNTNPNDLPEIIPKEELTFSGMDKLKMIFGAYLAMLPALIALILAFLLVYFFVS